MKTAVNKYAFVSLKLALVLVEDERRTLGGSELPLTHTPGSSK